MSNVSSRRDDGLPHVLPRAPEPVVVQGVAGPSSPYDQMEQWRLQQTMRGMRVLQESSVDERNAVRIGARESSYLVWRISHSVWLVNRSSDDATMVTSSPERVIR